MIVSIINGIAAVFGIIFIMLGLKSFIGWQNDRSLPIKGCFEHYHDFLSSKHYHLEGEPFGIEITPEILKNVYLFSILFFGCIFRIIVGLYLVISTMTDILS